MAAMRSLLAAAFLCSAATSAHAVDGVSLVYGQGNSVDVFGAELRTSEWRRWQLGDTWRVSAYGTGSVANWRAREHTENKELWDFGVVPVLRLERRGAAAAPYLEASFGGHLLSRRRINGNRELSTAFQFGEFIGGGVLFGPRQQYGFGARLQHISNGGIKNPNPGLTFLAATLRYEF